jgi:hypothetical protein
MRTLLVLFIATTYALCAAQTSAIDEQIRTINDFSVPGTESFKTEFSDDGGAHWIVTLQGTAHKVAR